MQVFPRFSRLFSGLFGLSFALFLSACTTFQIDEPVEPELPPIVVELPPEPEITIIPALPVEPEPEPLPEVLPEPPLVAIALTGRQPAYADVAEALSKLLDDYAIYDFSDRSQPPIAAFRLINDSEAGVVVAIGLRAARSSVAMSDVPVIFSQVFNYHDHELLTDNTRGVAALAPLAAYIGAWKQYDPTITRVGAIIGEGHDELIEEAVLAAEREDIQLTFRVVTSDQEALYHFRRMIRDIDGFWLFPDNRVLSNRSLNEILTQANQRRIPVAVSHDAMLPMGATISVSTVAEDIAQTIVTIVREIEAGRIERIPAVTSLSEARISTSGTVVLPQSVSRSDSQATSE